jgi:hypothetical protein
MAERQEFLEEFINIPTASVVGFDQLFELAEVVGPGPIQANEFIQLGADCGLQLLQIDILAPGLGKIAWSGHC